MDIKSNPGLGALETAQLAIRPPDGKTSTKEAAQMFEGMLWTQLFQAMRKTVQPSGLLGEEGQTRGTYEFLMDQAIVQSAMRSGKGLGLAARLEEAWSRQQAEAPKTP
jgi:Rod binding domain-containing protein